MARRKLSSAEEQRLIALAEAARDDPESTLERVDATTDATALAVVTLHLPVEGLRQIRKLAEKSHTSVSALMQDAVRALIARSAR